MLARIVGVFAFLFFALSLAGLVLESFTPKEQRPALRDTYRLLFPMPALALEFTERGRGLADVITNADDSGVRRKLQAGLVADSLFIALYLLLYVGIALVLARRGGAWAVAAALAAACAVGAAASDGAENLALARLVERHAARAPTGAQAADAETRTDASEAPDIKRPGLLKWVLSFATLALLSLTFWGRGSTLAWAAFGLCAFIALLGFVGLLVLRGSNGELRPVQVAFTLMLFMLPLVGYVLTFRWWLFAPAEGPR